MDDKAIDIVTGGWGNSVPAPETHPCPPAHHADCPRPPVPKAAPHPSHLPPPFASLSQSLPCTCSLCSSLSLSLFSLRLLALAASLPSLAIPNAHQGSFASPQSRYLPLFTCQYEDPQRAPMSDGWGPRLAAAAAAGAATGGDQ